MTININRVILGGNVVAKPEVSEISKFTKVCEFTIANNKIFYNRNGDRQIKSNYVDVVTWNKVADVALTLDKSEAIICEGELSENRWMSKDDSAPRKKLRLKAYKIYRQSWQGKNVDDKSPDGINEGFPRDIPEETSEEKPPSEDDQPATPEKIEELKNVLGKDKE